jgi:hypothetical protein
MFYMLYKYMQILNNCISNIYLVIPLPVLRLFGNGFLWRQYELVTCKKSNTSFQLTVSIRFAWFCLTELTRVAIVRFRFQPYQHTQQYPLYTHQGLGIYPSCPSVFKIRIYLCWSFCSPWN